MDTNLFHRSYLKCKLSFYHLFDYWPLLHSIRVTSGFGFRFVTLELCVLGRVVDIL